MFNAGQTCVSVERVYVLDKVYDQFVQAVVRDVEALRVGAGAGNHFGALIDEQQRAVTERHVADALARARGRSPAASRSPAWQLLRADRAGRRRPLDACMTEETFGPTLPIMKVASVAEAVRLANDSESTG